MEDCKCGRIPPCYSGRVFNIYEEAKRVKEEWDKTQVRWGAMIDKLQAKLMEGGFADDTYHKVYGVNEQLCDLGKTILTKNKDIMEEKKTKKMTKAEAFEYLKGKKVACDGLNNEDVQRKLFEVGIRWRGGKADVTAAAPFLYINPDGLTHGGSFEWFNLHEYEEISADDILSIEIVEEEEDTSMPKVEFERYVKILQAWSKRINSSFVFSERGMGIIHGDLLTKLEGEEKGAYYKVEATL